MLSWQVDVEIWWEWYYQILLLVAAKSKLQSSSILYMYFSFLQASFPYKTCSVESIMDGNLIAKLKEKYCHFDMVLHSVITSYNPIVVRPFGVWLKRKWLSHTWVKVESSSRFILPMSWCMALWYEREREKENIISYTHWVCLTWTTAYACTCLIRVCTSLRFSVSQMTRF